MANIMLNEIVTNAVNGEISRLFWIEDVEMEWADKVQKMCKSQSD